MVAGELLSLVGRAFRHDIKSGLSSGVLTPEGPKAHFPAACLAAVVGGMHVVTPDSSAALRRD